MYASFELQERAPVTGLRDRIGSVAAIALLSALAWAPNAHALLLPKFNSAAQTVPQCTDVTLHAAYLAEEKPGAGPGFLLEIRNQGKSAVAIADPVPLSVHWYAAAGAGRWLWRASSGSGGSLVNAMREKGALFAFQAPPDAPEPATRTILPHAAYSWAVFSSAVPSLRYRPGCEHCAYPGEQRFRAVLAYAYLPATGAAPKGLLRCGLRSDPVVMPPLPDSQKAHNSSTR